MNWKFEKNGEKEEVVQGLANELPTFDRNAKQGQQGFWYVCLGNHQYPFRDSRLCELLRCLSRMTPQYSQYSLGHRSNEAKARV